jgi:anti-anti-sigma factor
MFMFIEIDQQKDVCILRCAGRLVAGPDIGYIQIKIDEIRKLECNVVVADFREVISIGSVGVAFIVAVYTTIVRRPGGRFVLTGANALLQRVLDLTHLSGMIPQACDLASGLAILRAESMSCQDHG